jgi:hypothetical protein
MRYTYYINNNERGEFHADVRNEAEQTVFEIKGFEFFEDGFMLHELHLSGLTCYLHEVGIIQATDTLEFGN